MGGTAAVAHLLVLPGADDKLKLITAQCDGLDIRVPSESVRVGEHQGALRVLCVNSCGCDAEYALVGLVPSVLGDHKAAEGVRRLQLRPGLAPQDAVHAVPWR
jgi:hypothetical protein